MSSKTPSERAQSVKPESDNKNEKKSSSAADDKSDPDLDGAEKTDTDHENLKEGETSGGGENGNSKKLLAFPAATELNSRVRRLIAAFQRESKKVEQRQAQIGKSPSKSFG